MPERASLASRRTQRLFGSRPLTSPDHSPSCRTQPTAARYQRNAERSRLSGASGVAASSSTVLSQEHRLPIPIPPRQTEVPSGSPSRSRRGARISSSCHIFATCRSRCQRRVAVSHRRRRSSRAIPVRRSASCANRRPSVCRRHTLALRVLTKQQLDDAIERAGPRRVFAACLSMKDYCRETRSVEA